MSRYFIYRRKSSEEDDRQILSLESQSSETSRLAATRGVAVAPDDDLEEAMSAKAPGRPIFNEMMKRIYRREAEGIICWKLDRLARNPVDGGAIIWAIKLHGIKIVTPTQTYSRESDNLILLYIEFGMAQKYVDDLSKNVKRGLNTKSEHGWYNGVAPLGYLNQMDQTSLENIIVTDSIRFPLVKRMWDLMLTGAYSPREIGRIANEEWGFRSRDSRKRRGRPLSLSGIYNIFNRPFYYGKFEYPKGSGKWYQGKHQAMVTEAQFNRVQKLLGRNGIPRPQVHHEFAFTGMIRCGECSSMVTAEEKHQIICDQCSFKFASRAHKDCPRCRVPVEKMGRPKRLHYVYYHCTGKARKEPCSQKAISLPALEKQIDLHLARISIAPNFREMAVTFLHELHAEETETRAVIIESQQRAYKVCLQRLDGLVHLKTSPGNLDGSLLSDEEYRQQREGLLSEKRSLEGQINDFGERALQAMRLAEQTFEFASTAQALFAKGNPKAKKQVLAQLGSNLILKDKMLSIEATRPYVLLENSLSVVENQTTAIEPRNQGLTQSKKQADEPFETELLGEVEDVRTLTRKNEIMVAEIYHFFRSYKGSLYEIFPDGLNPTLLAENQPASRARHAQN